MGRGPLTLKERVSELSGNLQIDSSEAGAEVVATPPLAQVVWQYTNSPGLD